ncbi:MAG: S1 RNA-binding domain-containing protein, partial [Spirochaetaceae bacterium]|nr:S1 RNA-binding domain-containing protein [Spirochaetaceae bacterium]
GAFVDLGIKETALVHISELSDTFVKNPLDLVKAGDVLEFHIVSLDPDRRRISLSRKSGGAVRREGEMARNDGGHAGNHGGQSHSAGKAKVTVKKDSPRTGGGKPDGGFSRQNVKDDDGTMYNPFALAFKKK